MLSVDLRVASGPVSHGKDTDQPSPIRGQLNRSFAQPNFGASELSFPVKGTSVIRKPRTVMLWTIFVILLVLWLLGMVSSYTLGGYVHILLVVAIAVVLIRVIQGRNPIS